MTGRVFTGPGGAFRGRMHLPGDKSLSHRALILSAMAEGTSRLGGLATGADVSASATCLRSFGISIAADRVISAGIAAWTPPHGPLDAANSGTTLRLLAGAAAGRPFTTILDGDRSLRARPMRRLVAPLEALGARVEVTPEGTAPVRVHGAGLHGAEVSIPMASAQVRTAFALAALQAANDSTIDSPAGFRDHTERWLAALGRGSADGPTRFVIRPGPIPPLDIDLPGDTSSAAFLWTAAGLGNGEVTTPGVSLNPGRTGLLDVLAAMGATVEVEPTGAVLGDPTGTVTVRGPVQHGVRVAGVLAARTLDELPLVGVLGAEAEGETTVADAAELHGKESDRIAATVALLEALGVRAEPAADGFRVMGSGLQPGTFDARGDHRLAMAAAVAATRAGRVALVGIEAVAVSWPEFAETLELLWSSR